MQKRIQPLRKKQNPREEIGAADQLVLHADNGAPMKGATLLATLHKLGVVPSFSRPAVSDDNPYSEALFRTMKYRPDYPQAARQFFTFSASSRPANSRYTSGRPTTRVAIPVLSLYALSACTGPRNSLGAKTNMS